MSALTHADELAMLREAGAELLALSNAWRDQRLKRKFVGQFQAPISEARQAMLDLMQLLAYVREAEKADAHVHMEVRKVRRGDRGVYVGARVLQHRAGLLALRWSDGAKAHADDADEHERR